MQTRFQARRISKQRMDSLRKSGRMKDGILLDSFSGFLIVEPLGSNLGRDQVEAERGAQTPGAGGRSTGRGSGGLGWRASADNRAACSAGKGHLARAAGCGWSVAWLI